MTVSESQLTSGLIELSVYGVVSLYEKYVPPADTQSASAKDKESKEPTDSKEPKDKEPKEPKEPMTNPPTTPKMRVRRRVR